MPMGRPTKYKEEYCDALINHMSQGLSFESFAGTIRVCADTLYEWKKRHVDFSEAHKKGQQACRVFWEKIGLSGMLGLPITYDGKKITKPINATIWIFNMKNRFGWGDKVEHSVKEGGKFTFKKK